MSGHQFIMPPRKWADIDALALAYRAEFGLAGVADLPIVELMEMVMSNKLDWFEFDILTDVEMEGNEGQTCPNGKFIHIHEQVYIKACGGDARSRFTLAHELGHWQCIPMFL